MHKMRMLHGHWDGEGFRTQTPETVKIPGSTLAPVLRGRTLLAIDPTRHPDAEKQPGLVVAMRNAMWRYENAHGKI